MTRRPATPYCTRTPGCIYQATHKGDCLVRGDEREEST